MSVLFKVFGPLTIEKLTLSSPEALGFFTDVGRYAAKTLLEIPRSVLERANINVTELANKFADRVSSLGEMVSFTGPVQIYLPPGRGLILLGQVSAAAIATAIIGFSVFALLHLLVEKQKKEEWSPAVSLLVGAVCGVALAYLLGARMAQGAVRFS